MKPLTATKYKALRQTLGTQTEVARMLGIGLRTLQHREAGDHPVNLEMTIAMRALSLAKNWQRTSDRHLACYRKATGEEAAGHLNLSNVYEICSMQLTKGEHQI